MTHPVQWRGFRLWEKLLLLILPLLAIGALVLRFSDEAYLRRLARAAGIRPLILWLVNDSNALFVAGGLLLLAVGLLLGRRRRLNNDKRLWVSSGCPYCQERDLVRVKRKGRDRLYGYAGIPAYRYVCRNCNWRGLRIGRHEYSPQREKELEEAWRRFEPDGVPALASPATADGSPQVAATQEPPVDDHRGGGDTAHTPQPTTEPPAAPEKPEDVEWLWRRPSQS
jgi:LPXTG-motif cell wall-anchored protein